MRNSDLWVDKKTWYKPNGALRERLKEAPDVMMLHRLLVFCDFSNETILLDDDGPRLIELGPKTKLQKWIDRLTILLPDMFYRSRLIGLFFNREDGHYNLQVWISDREARRCAVLRDCFGAGLSKLTVIIGVLTHCDRTRLGFLPAYALTKEEQHKPIFEMTLQAETDIGQLKRGTNVTFVLDWPLNSIGYTVFGRCHQLYVCYLSASSAESAFGNAGSSRPMTIANNVPGPVNSEPDAAFIGKANLRKRPQTEEPVDDARKKEKRKTGSVDLALFSTPPPGLIK